MKLDLNQTLRLRRLELGYSQEHMASRLKISQQSYSKIENNPENTTLKFLLRISEILQIDPSILCGGSKKKVSVISVQEQLDDIKSELRELRKRNL